MPANFLESDFLHYLIAQHISPGDRVPTLNEISTELGISVGKLREQLEVARMLGVVSVRTRVGIQREPFDFLPAIRQGVFFGLESGEAKFDHISKLRQALEISFWETAVAQLTAADVAELKRLVACAWEKLRGDPIHVPTAEHRDLHLTIFSRLDNPFVQGLLEAYWEAYAAMQITRLMEYSYWVDVWKYHERIVAALEIQNFALGKELLIRHFSLLRPPLGRDNGAGGDASTE